MVFNKILMRCALGVICLGSSIPMHSVFYEQPSSYLDYPLEEGRYAVIFVEHEKTSDAKAKELVTAYAAKVAYRNGYRYFAIEAEQRVQVAQTTRPDQPPTNMFQDLIMDREYGRDYIERHALTGAQLYPGLQLLIRCSEENKNGTYQDACDWEKCEG